MTRVNCGTRGVTPLASLYVSSQPHCGLPDTLSNFQGYHGCNSGVLVGVPRNLSELENIVRVFPKVRAVGVGHSWNSGEFCSGLNSSAIDIVMTELDSVKNTVYTGWVQPVSMIDGLPAGLISTGCIRRQEITAASAVPGVPFPIVVDEQSLSVWVAAGVSQRILLDYLATYSSDVSKDGYTLVRSPLPEVTMESREAPSHGRLPPVLTGRNPMVHRPDDWGGRGDRLPW